LNVFQEFRRCRDLGTLRSRVTELSARFGALSRLDILTAVHAGRQQAICFLRMQTAEQERRLMKTLGVGRFGGEIVFVVDLPEPTGFDDSLPSSQWADSEVQ